MNISPKQELFICTKAENWFRIFLHLSSTYGISEIICRRLSAGDQRTGARQVVCTHGDISTIKIVRDKKTRICKGYAFIEMIDRKGAEAAAEALNGADMNGKQLTVKINEEPVAKPSYASRTFSQQRQPVYQKVSRPGTEERKKRQRRAL